jgi:ribokinase
MTLFNLGSINIDHVYRLTHLPRAGETLAAHSHAMGLGGKGANQTVAALRAGARVVHIGAIGQGDTWTEAALAAQGVALDAVARVDAVTGHAIIAVDAQGENQIIIHPGANRAQDGGLIARVLGRAGPGMRCSCKTKPLIRQRRRRWPGRRGRMCFTPPPRLTWTPFAPFCPTPRIC